MDLLADLSIDNRDPDAAGGRLEVLPGRCEADPHGQGQAAPEALQGQTQGGVQTLQWQEKQVSYL